MVIPFRLNNGASGVLSISFTYFVGGASCPADLTWRQDFLLRSTQDSLIDYTLRRWKLRFLRVKKWRASFAMVEGIN